MRKPDWTYWLNQADVAVSNAVMLSCNVDPRSVSEEDSRYILEEEFVVTAECNRRFAFVQSAIDAHVLEVIRRADRVPYVKLAEFRAWGESLAQPLTFPDEFPKASTIEPARTAASVPGNESRDTPAQRLRSDREQNLLRVIAGLWALSDLPSQHNTTADKLSALFDSWKWDKPAKQTIADTILKEAANLPGAVIRKSDG